MRLYVFGADWCKGCKALKAGGVVQKFAKAHPDVDVKEVNADSPRGERLLNAWGMEGIPAAVFTTDDFDDKTIGVKAEVDPKKKKLAAKEDDEDEEVEDDEVVLFKDYVGSPGDLEKFFLRAQKEETSRD